MRLVNITFTGGETIFLTTYALAMAGCPIIAGPADLFWSPVLGSSGAGETNKGSMSSSSAVQLCQNSVSDFLALTQERQWNPNRISESIPHLPLEASGKLGRIVHWMMGICPKCFIQSY